MKIKFALFISLLIVFQISKLYAQESASEEEEIPLADLITMVDSANTAAIKNVLSGRFSANLRSIKFNSGKTILDLHERMYLDTVADYLVNIPTIDMSVDGYTDNVGAYPRNVNLSKQRANAVAAYLVQKGVRKGQLKSNGYGPDKPIASNTSVEGRAKNRRVELHFLKTDFSADSKGDGKQGADGRKEEKMTKIKMKDGSQIDAKYASLSPDGKELRYIPNGPDETVKILRTPDIQDISYPDGTIAIPEKDKKKEEQITKIKMQNGTVIEAKYASISPDGKELRYIANGPDETVKVLRIADVNSISNPDGTQTVPAKLEETHITKIKMKDGSEIEAKFVSYSSDGLSLRYIPNGPDETVKVLRISDVQNINYPDGTVALPENKPDPLPEQDAFKAAKTEINKREGKELAIKEDKTKDNPPVTAEPDVKRSKFQRKVHHVVNETRYGKFLKGNYPFLAFGLLPLTAKNSNAVLTIANTGNSTYRSSLNSKRNFFGIGLQVGLERETAGRMPLYFRFMYQWATINGAQLNAFSGGVGWLLGKSLQYKVGIDMETGYVQKRLHNINLNGGTYIVNNIIYKGNVTVRYRNSYFAISPNVTYEICPKNFFASFRINGGVTLGGLRKTSVKFNGLTANGGASKTFANVDGRYIYLEENGDRSSAERIFWLGGLHLTVGMILK